MKTHFHALILSLPLIGTGTLAVIPATVLAQEATLFVDDAPPATRTRAEVMGQVLRARADGTLADGGEASVFAGSAQFSTRTRAEVKAEVAKARADGTLNDGGEAPPIQTARERTPVQAAGYRDDQRVELRR